MKKNNKMKIGLTAGLLITPAIVAQAEQVQASETMSAETIIEIYIALNENTSATALQNAKADFDANRSVYEGILTQEQLEAIKVKLEYLEKFLELKTQANEIKAMITNNIITPSKTLADDLKGVKKALSTLNEGFAKMQTILPNIPGPDDLFDNLLTATMDENEFLTAHITDALLAAVENSEDYIPKITAFIEDYIKPIVTASDEPIDGEAYTEDAKAAQTAFNELAKSDPDFQKALGVQLVPTTEQSIKVFLANAANNVTAAQNVMDKISLLKPEEITSTNIEAKMKAINEAYNKLKPLQKALVLNYEDIAEYQEVLEVVAAIKTLPSLNSATQEFRNQLPVVEDALKKLGELKSLVSNAGKLAEYRVLVDKAIEVDKLITAITIEDVAKTLPAAQAAYKGLSATERKYVLKVNVDILTQWESSNKSSAAVVKLINDIPVDSLKQLTDSAVTDSRKIQTIANFITKVRSAESAYNKIKAGETEQKLVTNSLRLEGLIPIVNIADKFTKLNVSADTYEADLQAAQAALNTWDASNILQEDQVNIEKLQQFLTGYIQALTDEKQAAEKLKQAINALKEAKPVSLSAIAEARAKYNAMSANGRKLVDNIGVLEALEKEYKEAISVVALINALDVEARDFARKTLSAQAAYDKLTLKSKEIVDNKVKLDELLPIAQLMVDIDAIRSTAKDFKEIFESAKTRYDAIITGEQTKPEDPQKDYLAAAKYRLAVEYGPKLVAHLSIIDQAKAMEDKIEALKNKTGQTFMTDLKIVSDEYKKLNSTIKRNVGNAKVLSELERDYKATLRVIDQIEKLPKNTDKSFSSKVTSAQKAYERLTDKQKNDVFNYTTNLKPLLKAADLISRIDKLRVGSKTYQQEVAAIRAEFELLTPAEQELVHNISKLESAEQGMTKAEEVIKLIDAAIPTAENYLEKLIAAREAFENLPRNEQKLVTNIKDLTTRERAVKPILKLDADILALDPSNAKTFISRYKSAQKAYEKLKMAERALLTNIEMLTGEWTQLYEVMNAISSIKNSSKTFIQDTQAARALYEALPSELQAKVSNYDILKGHELNVEGGSVVDALIRDLNNAVPQDFVMKVKEARAAYNSLSSANKKAVSLVNELKAQEKYIKPVEAAIKAIDDLSNPRKDLSRQFTTVNKALQKLDAKQKTYITNIDKYSNLSNVIHVYTMIDNLKTSDKYYQGNMEAAKTAYDRLSEEEKLKVTNYYKLQEALLDITEVQKVMSIIASLNPSSSSFITDVEKAAAAYKELPSGSRKQVLNYSELKQAEKDIKAAQKVIKQIDDLEPTLPSYESKTKSAQKAYERLTESQKPLILNYNKLQAAIFELGL